MSSADKLYKKFGPRSGPKLLDALDFFSEKGELKKKSADNKKPSRERVNKRGGAD